MATMQINLIDTPDDNVRMEIGIDEGVKADPDKPMTASMVMLMGIRMLFDSGDVWQAGLMAAAATHNGGDPRALAQAIKEARKDMDMEDMMALASTLFADKGDAADDAGD